MVWDSPIIDVPTPPRTMTASVSGNTFTLFCDGRPSDPHPTDFPNATIGGGFTYTGPGGSCNLHFEIDQGPSVAEFFITDFTQDGNPIDIVFSEPQCYGLLLPFVNINRRRRQCLCFDGFFQGVTGQGPTNRSGVLTPAN